MSIYNNTITTEFTPVWLMIKQHNVTGLKYFCKTTKKNPYRYNGSGLHWRRHLAKHGSDVTTKWCELFTDKDMLVEFALFFSEEFNIVQSSKWANLKPENGLDGWTPGQTQSILTREKQRLTRKINGVILTSESRNKISQAHKGKCKTSETRKKMSGSAKGRIMSEETKQKLRKPKSEETKRKLSAANTGKSNGPMTEEAKAKFRETLRLKKLRT